MTTELQKWLKEQKQEWVDAFSPYASGIGMVTEIFESIEAKIVSLSKESLPDLTVEEAKDQVAMKYEKEDYVRYDNWYDLLSEFKRGNIDEGFLNELTNEAMELYAENFKD